MSWDILLILLPLVLATLASCEPAAAAGESGHGRAGVVETKWGGGGDGHAGTFYRSEAPANPAAAGDVERCAGGGIWARRPRWGRWIRFIVDKRRRLAWFGLSRWVLALFIIVPGSSPHFQPGLAITFKASYSVLRRCACPWRARTRPPPYEKGARRASKSAWGWNLMTLT